MALEMDLSPDLAFLVSVWMEAVLYGLLAVMFIQSLVVLLKRAPRQEHRGPKLMLLATTFMFSIATVHIAVNLLRLIQAFIYHRESEENPGGPAAYLGMSKDALNIVQVALFGSQSLIGDVLNIWRCYIVWNRSWKVTTVPLLLLTLSSASGILVFNQYSNIPSDANLFDHQTSLSITLFYATAPLQNIITTTLIAYRIWSVDRQTRTARSNFSLIPALLIFVESAAFYSIAELLLLVLYLLGMNAQFLMLETLTPIVGIVFTSIIIRVGLRADSGQPSSANSKIALSPIDNRISFAPVDYIPNSGKHSRISVLVSQSVVRDVEVASYVEGDELEGAYDREGDEEAGTYVEKPPSRLDDRSQTSFDASSVRREEE